MAIAKEQGHEFNSDRLSQLSEEELEGMAGAMHTNPDCSLVVTACGYFG